MGFYSPEMATEDIDLTWRLQLRHWDVRYEANAVIQETFVQMAERALRSVM